MNGVKFMNFMSMCWIISTLLCLVIEGSFLGTNQQSVLNQLVPFTVVKVGGIVPIPCLNVYFFHAVARVLVWDYSFYYGGYEALRWVMFALFSPGLAWGIGTFFIAVFAEFVRVF